MAEPMRVRALEQGGVTEVKILMRHDMETGLRKTADGKAVPAHFIQNLSVRHKDKEVISAQLGPSIAKDPFVSFKFKGGVKGDKVTVTWSDNKGDKRSDDTLIA